MSQNASVTQPTNCYLRTSLWMADYVVLWELVRLRSVSLRIRWQKLSPLQSFPSDIPFSYFSLRSDPPHLPDIIQLSILISNRTAITHSSYNAINISLIAELRFYVLGRAERCRRSKKSITQTSQHDVYIYCTLTVADN